MDPRQPPQLPFSRNGASPYDRSPFPPTSTAGSSNPNQSPYPPAASHPPHGPPQGQNSSPYPPDQRRSAESPSYYSSGPRPYPREPGSIPPPHPPQGSHSRHHSASSLPPGPPNRAMPPPGSPPQPSPGQAPQGSQQSQPRGHYGLPPPRAPAVSSAPFAGGRELPSLNQLPRTGNAGSSMSISSILGGPPAASRDGPEHPQAPPSQYPPATTAASGSTFAPSVQASPRMHSAEYQHFRRPQTPEQHSRPYDPRADPRASVAASPQGAYSTTPETQRYGTPQSYHQRAPSQQEGGEPSRMPGGPPPLRPGSPPKTYAPNNMPPRQMDAARGPGLDDPYARRDEPPRGSMEYNPERVGLKPYGYEDRYRNERERRDEIELRDREQRERAYSGGDGSRGHPANQGDYREPPRGQPPPFGRPPDARDPRDHPSWGRPPYEQSRAPYDPAGYYPPAHEQPPAGGLPYPGHAGPGYPPHERYPPSTHPPSSHPMPPQHGPPQPYDSPERARMNLPHPGSQPPPGHRRSHEEGPPPPSVAYNPAHGQYDSPRKHSAEESQPQNNRGNMLAVQGVDRKGRVSPLPQAVQGAQPQLPGPAGEPGIKSEFGRMFSGIGSGVSGIVSSPVAPGAQLPFTNAGLARRDDTDSAAHDSGPDVLGKAPSKARRRKLKDVEAKVEDESTGRSTPVGGRKRHKPHHHHQYAYLPLSQDDVASLDCCTNSDSHHHHHAHGPHHHHHEASDQPPGPNLGTAPFKNVKGNNAPVPSPTSLGKEVPRQPLPSGKDTPAAKAAPASLTVAVIPPKPKTIISSKEVLRSVAHLRRTHLGDVVYEPKLQAARQLQRQPPDQGYESTPTPLPWSMIKDRENCTLTVKVARAHLTGAAREEITRRRAVWGTDVYTDDSDVVAACIHGGWIRGAWPDSVDVNLLELDRSISTDSDQDIASLPPKQRKKEKEKDEQARAQANSATYHDHPPKTGPVHVQQGRDLHVSLLVLPRLSVYGSTTRFGIKSREFGGVINERTSVHDGISFKIMSIRWVENGAGPQSRLRGKARRERIRKAMAEVQEVNFWPDTGCDSSASVFTAPGQSLAWRANGEKGKDGRQDRDKEDKKNDGEDGSGKVEKVTAGDGDKENRPVDQLHVAAERASGEKDEAAGETKALEGDKMQVDGQGANGA